MTTNSALNKYSCWAVTEEDGGILISLARYGKINEFVWFIRIEGDGGAYISFFPYISTFHLSLEIRSNNAFPVSKDIVDTALEIYPGAEPLEAFESGPIVGFFPYGEKMEVAKCIKLVSSGLDNVPLKERARWAIYTHRMANWLRSSIPLVRTLKTPSEVLGI